MSIETTVYKCECGVKMPRYDKISEQWFDSYCGGVISMIEEMSDDEEV